MIISGGEPCLRHMTQMSLLSKKFTKNRNGYETAYEGVIGAVVITPVSIEQLRKVYWRSGSFRR
jgi:hypothetical protein